MKIHVELEFTTDVLAGSPSDPDVYATYIASKAIAATDAHKAEEVDSIVPSAEVGFSIFPRLNGIPHFWDYHIRGYLKESAAAITGSKASNPETGMSSIKSKIDKWLFVDQRRLMFYRNDEVIENPEKTVSRIVRAWTMQGPRTTPKKSEAMLEGAVLKFDLVILPLGEQFLTAELLADWFDYGKWSGMGEWRTGSNGRFVVNKFEILEAAPKRDRKLDGRREEKIKKSTKKKEKVDTEPEPVILAVA